ncbi:hypothetical protein HMN09_00320500 [Mycena chlorophos]|uniref:RCC1/BLIP-II protein n=1 Tax=Mycena chlorophos TaxID=658473 RepID=A0A8H6TFW9_MYCCL|nr:hypothetical protein HMN09_00320500 [Mycena chlorophos]
MLLSAGSNAHGQLSNSTLDDAHSFTPCSFSDNAQRRVLHLAFGANHTLALVEPSEGRAPELWGCGDGRAGQLGPEYTRATVLTRLDLDLPTHYVPRLIAAGWETSYVVLSCPGKPDTVISFGGNDFGDLGVETATPTANGFHVVDPGFRSRVRSIAAGQHHVLLVSETGLAVGWGASRHGQLGETAAKPFTSTPVVVAADIAAAAVGHHHSVLLHKSGTILGLGSNRKHQLDRLEDIRDATSIHCTWNGTSETLPNFPRTANSCNWLAEVSTF